MNLLASGEDLALRTGTPLEDVKGLLLVV
jgi:hypothetical protein